MEDEKKDQETAAGDVAAAPAEPPKSKEEEYLEGWKRANADYANLKKEMERMREETAKYACAEFAAGLLPVLDSFRKAEAARPKEDAPDPQKSRQWMDGIALVRGQFETALRNAGVAAIEETGVPFDPSLHEALLMEKGGKDDIPGSVIRIIDPGYKLKDRILRAAKVVVAE